MTPQTSLWWKEYRNILNYRRTNDQRLRRTLRNVFKEYLNNCSILGLNHVMDRGVEKVQRTYWICVVLGAHAIMIFSLLSSWNQILEKPLIVSLETSVYPIQNIDFPAVALCNVNRISRNFTFQMADRMWPRFTNFTYEKLQSILMQFGRLIDFETGDYDEMTSFVNNIPPEYLVRTEFVATMKKMAPRCENMLVKCFWNGVLYRCSDLFDTRRTSHGHCCCFNYVMDFNKFGRPHRVIKESKRQSEAGAEYGLAVVIDVQVDDYAYPLHNIIGTDILIFDAEHYADHNNGLMIHRILSPNSTALLEIHSREQIATPEVRKYSPKTVIFEVKSSLAALYKPIDGRNCLFKNERPEGFGNMYSYSSCIISCRVKTVHSLCRCVPYFYPVPQNQSRVCTLSDLPCLNKYKEKLLYLYPVDTASKEGLDVELQDSLFCPHCLPDCEFIRHSTKASITELDGNFGVIKTKGFNYPIIRGINMKNKSLLYVFHPVSDSILDRMDVVNYWYEVLSNFGGSAGLLVGFCVISWIEIIYFATIRLGIAIYEKIFKAHQHY